LGNLYEDFLFVYTDQEDRNIQSVVAVSAAANAVSTGWDDPTEVNWGADDDDDKEEPIVPEPKEAIFKCTALYSYTVSWIYIN